MKKVTPTMPSDYRQAVEAHERISRATGEGAPSEPAGPSGSLACDGVVGLRPAQASVYQELTKMADEYEAAQLERTSGTIRLVAEEYRRHSEWKIKRQPEPNVRHEPDGGKAAPKAL